MTTEIFTSCPCIIYLTCLLLVIVKYNNCIYNIIWQDSEIIRMIHHIHITLYTIIHYFTVVKYRKYMGYLGYLITLYTIMGYILHRDCRDLTIWAGLWVRRVLAHRHGLRRRRATGAFRQRRTAKDARFSRKGRQNYGNLLHGFWRWSIGIGSFPMKHDDFP